MELIFLGVTGGEEVEVKRIFALDFRVLPFLIIIIINNKYLNLATDHDDDHHDDFINTSLTFLDDVIQIY